MSCRRGPPKHQNKFAWKPNAGRKINETEVGGRLRPLSEITGVCLRCKDQIDWKRRYGKYKPLTEPAKCQLCSKRNVRQAYHNLCRGCAKDQNVCAKCRCPVDCVVGRDSSELEAEQKMLEEAIKNARERDRRTLLRTMNNGKTNNAAKDTPEQVSKVGELFPSSSLEDYARTRGCRSSGGSGSGGGGVHPADLKDEDVEEDEDEEDEEDEAEGDDDDQEEEEEQEHEGNASEVANK